MPSSDPITIPKVLRLVELIQPKSILDVGCGNGRYGFLFREILDWNYGRMAQGDWETYIFALDAEKDYFSTIHHYVYHNGFAEEWLSWDPAPLLRQLSEAGKVGQPIFDLIFLGDVLEHFPEGKWQRALMKAKQFSKFTIVVCPNWHGSIAQEAWGGNEFERHHVVLSPSRVGGRCVYANSKAFISVFDNYGTGMLEMRDILL